MPGFIPLPYGFQVTQKTFCRTWRKHVTASIVTMLMNADPDKSGIQQARETFGGAPSPPKNEFAMRAINHGNFYEKICVDRVSTAMEYFNSYDKTLGIGNGEYSFTCAWKYQSRARSENFIFSATPDLVLRNEQGQHIPIEIKCPFKVWSQGMDVDTISVKINWWVQAMLQSLILQSTYGYIIVYFPERGPSKPEQWMIYKTVRTQEVDSMLLTEIHKIYVLLASPTGVDSFRAKSGEKGQKMLMLNSLMEKTMTLINKKL